MAYAPPDCCDCLFYEPEDAYSGTCRRYAPRPSNLELAEDEAVPLPTAVWPFVQSDDWCGEFEQAPEERLLRNKKFISGLKEMEERMAGRGREVSK